MKKRRQQLLQAFVVVYLCAVSEGAELGALVALAVAVDLVLVVGAPAPVGDTGDDQRGTAVEWPVRLVSTSWQE